VGRSLAAQPLPSGRCGHRGPRHWRKPVWPPTAGSSPWRTASPLPPSAPSNSAAAVLYALCHYKDTRPLLLLLAPEGPGGTRGGGPGGGPPAARAGPAVLAGRAEGARAAAGAALGGAGGGGGGAAAPSGLPRGHRRRPCAPFAGTACARTPPRRSSL
jgi:hypothetical protein